MVIHRSRRVITALSLLLAAFYSSDASARAHTPIPLEVAFGAPKLWDEGTAVAVSRDGRRIAYVTRQIPSDFDAGSDARWRSNGAPRSTAGVTIFVTETNTRQTQQACVNGGYSWGPAWSPDGSQLAFYSDASGAPTLWIYETASATCRQIAAEPVKLKYLSGDEIQWLPDGSTVIVPLYPEGNSAQAVVASDAAMRAPEVQGDLELYASGSEARNQPLRSDAPGNDQSVERALDVQYRVSLAAVDIRTGALRRFDTANANVRPAATLQISPSGRWITALSVPKPAADGRIRFDLGIIDTASGSTHRVANEVSMVGAGFSNLCYAWHPRRDELVYAQGGSIYLAAVDRRGISKRKRLGAALGPLDQQVCWFTADGKSAVVRIESADVGNADFRESLSLTAVAQLAVLPLDGSAATRVDFRDEPWAFENLIATREHIVWQPEADTLTIIGREQQTGQRVAIRIGIKDGSRREIWKGRARLEDFDAGRDNPVLFASYEDRSTPKNIFALTATLQRGMPLSRVSPQLEGTAVGDAQIFLTSVPQHDHSLEQARTAVLLPPGVKPGDRPPAIVAVYPSYDATTVMDRYGGGNLTGIPAHVFTDRGYAVVYPEISVGPGSERGNILDEIMDSLMAQVYAAAERGLIDSSRLAVHGNSFGGYAAAAIVTRTNLFRASIPSNGIYDLVSYSYSGAPDGNIYWSEHLQPRLGGPLWEQRARYVDNSPLYQADKIKTPMLILQGGADWTRPQAEELYVGMQRLDKPVQLAIYESGGHWVGDWRLKQAIAGTERVLEFLARHLTTDGMSSSKGDRRLHAPPAWLGD